MLRAAGALVGCRHLAPQLLGTDCSEALFHGVGEQDASMASPQHLAAPCTAVKARLTRQDCFLLCLLFAAQHAGLGGILALPKPPALRAALEAQQAVA